MLGRDDSSLVGRTVAGGFRLVSAITGGGGLSSVYRAERDDGTAAAVKVLHPLFLDAPPLRRRFEREAELVRRLAGRGAAAALGSGELDGRPYLVLELVDGELLARRLEQPVDARSAVRIARAILEALDGIHQLGVVHRDIKPTNVMLLPDGRAKLIDFGVASRAGLLPAQRFELGDLPPDDRTPSAPLGTPGYSAPEQIEGKSVDGRADLYSVGVLLFEMLCGRRPFVGDPMEVLRGHLERTPPTPQSLAPSLSAQLDALVLIALAKSPESRPPSARALSAGLAATPEGARR